MWSTKKHNKGTDNGQEPTELSFLSVCVWNEGRIEKGLGGKLKWRDADWQACCKTNVLLNYQHYGKSWCLNK